MTERADAAWVKDLIGRTQYLVLATSGEDGPWVAPVEPIADEDLNFYFFSTSDARHSRHIEAGKYKVLPLDGEVTSRLGVERPQTSRPRSRFTYYPGLSAVPQPAVPQTLNGPHSIEANVTIPPSRAERVLLANGGAAGGFVLYVMDGRLHYLARDFFTVSSVDDLSEGRRKLRFEFEPTGAPDFTVGKGASGQFQLYVDRVLVGNVDVPHTTPMFYKLEGLSCGYDSGAPVLADVYSSPFSFTGTIHEVVVDLEGELIEDDDAIQRRLMSQQ